MILRKLTLNNFRNYDFQELDFNGRFNFIHGDNGHGKTNVLEAISLLSFGKSFIGSSEYECVRFGYEELNVLGRFESDSGSNITLGLNYNTSVKKKSFQLNKEKVTRYSSEVFGKFPVVFFSPHSLNITYGNPSERRKFFDIVISQTNLVYLDNLKNLNKLLKLKNALLKRDSGSNLSNGEFDNLLNVYNEKLAEVSAEIIFKRIAFLKEFEKYFRNIFGNLIKGQEKPGIKYYSELFEPMDLKNSDLNRNDLQEKFSYALDEKKSTEIARGISLIGPQRDDYIFSLHKKTDGDEEREFAIKNYASQGEHKTFVLALKLSEYYYVKDKVATNPILLLDDILSELDFIRVSKIVSHLKDFGQIFLTTTDVNYKKSIIKYYGKEGISSFKIISGRVYDEKN